MNDGNNFGQRQMVQGNWTCSSCQAQITELPFQPDGTRPVFCGDCHRKQRQDRPRRF
ncbi:hypothetical protein CMO96_01425 [Candidatus Woesebacteria bacterium]|nr:hypothetical protein [Candidatus Woesebacteria bacterium]